MPAKSNSPRHLLRIDDLSDPELSQVLTRTEALSRGQRPARIDATVANLFFEASTRTRVSFELAAARLGMRVINIELDRSSTTKGESLEDTVATLTATGIDCVVLRHPETGRCQLLADRLQLPVSLLNAGDGTGEHPSQALLDAATLNATGIDWASATIAVVGDIRHSRVARSSVRLFQRLGAGRLRIAGPPELMPEGESGDGVIRCNSLDEAVADADVVMMLRVQRERMDAVGWPDPDRYHQRWGLTSEKLALARPECVVMHPGPINRGMEISAELAEDRRALILDQVRMGVFARMAIFEWLFETHVAD